MASRRPGHARAAGSAVTSHTVRPAAGLLIHLCDLRAVQRGTAATPYPDARCPQPSDDHVFRGKNHDLESRGHPDHGGTPRPRHVTRTGHDIRCRPRTVTPSRHSKSSHSDSVPVNFEGPVNTPATSAITIVDGCGSSWVMQCEESSAGSCCCCSGLLCWCAAPGAPPRYAPVV